MAQEEKKESVDTGLGLNSFLAKKEAPAIESSPAKTAAPADKPDDKKPEAPIEDKKAAAPAKQAKEEQPTEKAASEAKADEKASPDFKPNWDDDNNPWKKKATEFDQRYRDTHRNWNSLNQQNQELQRQLTILSKKFDGTYDPAVDEPRAPDPAAVRQWGAVEGKAQASYAAAVRVHGEDKVKTALDRYQEAFGNDVYTQQRILASQDPVQAAMDAVAGYEFFSKYGNDPGRIIETLRKELETELSPKIAERESQRIMAEIAKQNREPDGLGRVLGASGAGDKKVARDNAGRPKPLGAITGFGH